MFIPARYRIALYDAKDDVVDVLFDFESLRLAHTKNEPATASLVISSPEKVTSFVQFGRVRIDRSIPSWGVPWYREFNGVFVGFDPIESADGLYRYTANFADLKNLLARRVVAYLPGSARADKTGMAESVVKSYVEENMGPSAASPSRFFDGSIAGFSVETTQNRGEGTTVEGGLESLLSIVKNNCDVNRLVFDIVERQDDRRQLVFIIKDELDGFNRSAEGIDAMTGLNRYGLTPVVFSEIYDNAYNVSMSDTRDDEVNRIVVSGNGTGSDVAIAVVEGDVPEANYGRHEAVISATAEAQDHASLTVFGEKEIKKLRYRRKLQFTPLQSQGYAYGKDYWHGDVISANLLGVSGHFEIKGVGIDVTGDSENVNLTLEEYEPN